MSLFLKKLFLKVFWWFVLSFVAFFIFALSKSENHGLIAIIWVIITIYAILKKIDLSEENNKPFLLKFFSYSSSSNLSNTKSQEELDLKITHLINQIHDGNYSIDVPIRLNTDEKAYLSINGAEWHETRVTMKSVSYGHLSQNFKIAKGLNFKIGNVKPIPHKKSEFTKIAEGDFYITSDRIMLVSPSETKKIDLKNILNVSIFKDGILLHRDSGKSVFIPMPQDVAFISKAIIDNV